MVLLILFGLFLGVEMLWLQQDGALNGLSTLVQLRNSPADDVAVMALRAAATGQAAVEILLLLAPMLSFVLMLRLARTWAAAASELMATSGSQNREVLRAARSASVPIGLFLRGFEEEARSIDSLAVLPLSKSRVVRATRWIESEIVEGLEQRGNRVFCIANPSDRFLLPGALRLEVTDDQWVAEVTELAADADVVVLYLSTTSPGLLLELELLRREDLMSKCVVVVGRSVRRRHGSITTGFPLVILAPSLALINQSYWGPIIGRFRFRRELGAAIERATNRRST